METGFETQLVNALQHVCAQKKKKTKNNRKANFTSLEPQMR